MLVPIMRTCIDLDTRQVMSRETVDAIEMSDSEYSSRMIRALTGMSPREAARQLMDNLDGKEAHP